MNAEQIQQRVAALSEAQRLALASELGVVSREWVAAFVTPSSSASGGVDCDLVKRGLHEQLPVYMVPALISVVDSLPRLSNGKVDRVTLKARAKGMTDRRTESTAPATTTEQTLIAIWQSVLGSDQIGVHDNFFEIGGDSITSIQIVAKARAAGVMISAQDLMEHLTIAGLATVVPLEDQPLHQTKALDGVLALTPIQRWFLSENFSAPEHWNQAVVVEFARCPETEVLRRVLSQLLKHHDMLRCGLSPDADLAGGWSQEILPIDRVTLPFTVHDFSDLNAQEGEIAIHERMEAAQKEFVFDRSLLVRTLLFRLTGGRGRLGIVLHHLITDAMSWGILLEDLRTLLDGGALPAKSTSYRQRAETLADAGESGSCREQAGYWLSTPKLPALVVSAREGENGTEGAVRSFMMEWTESQTATLVHAANSAYHTRTEDLLVTALVESVRRWLGRDEGYLRIGLERHGRDDRDGDVARTVGWFTNFFPVNLEWRAEAACGWGDRIKSIKEQLRAVPEDGRGFGVLRYLDAQTEQSMTALPKDQLLFNYLGRMGDFTQLRNDVVESVTLWDADCRAAENCRSHPLEINAWIEGDRFLMRWSFDELCFPHDSLQTLMDGFRMVLDEILDHCSSAEDSAFTPSDFPEAELDQAQLDQLMSRLN